jgi:hypothetical protein
MVLGDLLSGRSEWSPGPIHWAPASGQASDALQLLMANSYSSRGRPTGPEGSLPSVKEYHEFDIHQDSNMGSKYPRHPHTGVLAASVP